MVPPEGVEDEAGAIDGSESEEELHYYSCSDSESEASSSSAKPAAVVPSAAEQPPLGRVATTSAEGVSEFEQRVALFRCGEGAHTWRPAETASFNVRSATYLKDRRKAPASFSMLELVSVEMLTIGPEGPVPRVALHSDLYPAWARRRGDGRFFFIQNWILPPYQAVMVGALDPEAPWLMDDTPQARVWQRFLAMTLEQQKASLKTIMSIDQGPWLVRHAVPKKPLLACRQLKTHTHYKPLDHFEVVMDVASGGKTEQMATHLVMKALRNLQLSMATLIEGKSEDELPEALLWGASVSNVDTARLRSPKASTSK